MKAERYIDQDGNIYESARELARVLGVSRPHFWKQIQTNGEYYNNARRLHIVRYTDEVEAPAPVEEKPVGVFARLAECYSPQELEMLANGGSLANRRLTYPDIFIGGKHHKFMVISDTHVGSIYSPKEWHEVTARLADSENVDAVLHCGDLVDGVKRGRDGQIYELDAIGYKQQLNRCIEVFSQYNKPIYIISGNHDSYFMQSAGADIVDAFAKALPNVTYIGNNSGDLNVDGCIVRLFHGGDGSSYATSYRLQKLCAMYENGKKPDILLAGHVHKYCVVYDRGIHAVSVPAMQMLTKYMEAKRLEAHTGALIIEFDTYENKVRNFKTTYFPFYA